MNGHLYTGWNSRLDEIQAMVIRVRQARFADEQADRDQVAAIYDSYIPAANRLRTPNGGRGMRVTYHQYWVRCAGPRSAARSCWTQRASTPGSTTTRRCTSTSWRSIAATSGTLAEAERAGREILTLPIHAALPFADAAAYRRASWGVSCAEAATRPILRVDLEEPGS